MTDVEIACKHCGELIDAHDYGIVSLDYHEKLEDDSDIWSRGTVYLCRDCWDKIKPVVTNDDLERVVLKKPGEGIEQIDTSRWKRCPFCKGEPRAIVGGRDGNRNCIDRGNVKHDYFGTAACHECGVQMHVTGDSRGEVAAELRRLWNARAGKTCIRCGAKQVDE